MERALPQARVDGYQGLVLTLTLPDPDDRHVLAAAMHSGAPHLLTFNLDDFPASALPVGAPQAVHPDHWLAPVLADHPAGALQALEKVVAGLKNPPMNIHEMTEHLVRLRLPTTATVLRGLTNML